MTKHIQPGEKVILTMQRIGRLVRYDDFGRAVIEWENGDETKEVEDTLHFADPMPLQRVLDSTQGGNHPRAIRRLPHTHFNTRIPMG